MRRVTGACDTTRPGSTRKPLIGNLRVTVRRFVRSTRNRIRSCIIYLLLKLSSSAVPDFRSTFFCEIQFVGHNIVESVEKKPVFCISFCIVELQRCKATKITISNKKTFQLKDNLLLTNRCLGEHGKEGSACSTFLQFTYAGGKK